MTLGRIVTLCFSALVFAGIASAQPFVPERRTVFADGFDLPGGDLATILDTSLENCERACLRDSQCTAFTYNARNGSCFPKSNPGAPVAYARAISGAVTDTPAQVVERATARAAELNFLRKGQFTAALKQASELGQYHVAGAFSAEALRSGAMEAETRGDKAAAMRLWGATANVTDTPGDWESFARLTLEATETNANQARSLSEQATSAAVNAYLRADAAAQRHTILTVLAKGLERIDQGANGVKVLRLAQSIRQRDDTAAALERMAGLYGMRIDEHRVDSNRTTPRICAIFTEDLIEKGVDYTPYVQLPQPGMTVEPGGWRELCVAGVKHGERVTVTFREGLPAADGQTLAKSVPITAYVRDRNPAVSMAGSGYVLPRGGAAAIPVRTVNATQLELEVWRVSDRSLTRSLQSGWLNRPMDEWEASRFSETVGEKIWSGTATVPSEVNRDMTTRLPLDAAMAGQPAGIYVLRAAVPGIEDYENPPVWQWFVTTDLGVTTLSGVDGLTVAVRSLTDAAAKPGVQVEVVSRSNRVLATGTTDQDGIVRLDAAALRGTGTAQPALVTVTDGEADMAFLSLADPEFDLTDRGVAGRDPSPPIDLFLATDRGAYRAGETMNATALARDGEMRAIAGLPLTARLRRPDGVEYARQRISDVAGGFAISMPIAGNAPRGAWKLDILADTDAPPLATTGFLVEDFLPERIDFTLNLEDAPLVPGQPTLLGLEARYLFGAPGAELHAEGDVVLREAAALAGYEGYRFGLADTPFSPQMVPIENTATTDAQGKAEIHVTLPEVASSGRPLEASLRLRVAEGSGRPVERVVTRPVAAATPLIGVKPAFDEVVPEGQDARFDVILVGADQMPATWRLDRLDTRYQWYNLDGSWNWEPMTTRSSVSKGEITLGSTPVNLSGTVEWGQYEMTVTAADGSVATSVRFDAGWYAPADTTRSPDTLELSLDKPAYRPGETARLRIVPKAAGTALVAVLSNRVIALKSIQVSEGATTIDLPVTDEWGAGVYVTASVLRPMEAGAGRLPARALGLAHAAIDPGPRKLLVNLETSPEAEPRAPMPVALKVEGLAPGDTAWATIAAVDVGILNLTRYKAPDPLGHYFGQRKLGVGIRDLYGRLIDGLNGAEGQVRSGGDAGRPNLLAPPPTEELVAYFSGPIEVGADGYARTSFDLPAFNGTVRVMAVVWSETAVGQAQSDVLVRDPVVVTASLPRFLQPNDQSRLLLEIVHARGPAGRMGLDVTANGVTLGAGPSGIDLAENGKAVVEIPVRADEPGLATLSVRLTTPDGKVLARSLNLPVERNDPLVQRVSRLEVQPGQSVTLDDSLFDPFVKGSAHAMVSSGSLARFDAPGLLAALDAYPWGCSEQLTSRALPLLYFDQMAQAMGLQGGESARERIAQTIDALLVNQTAEGGFGLWSASGGANLWLDSYVTDFLSRARAQGHEVPDRAFRAALDTLRNQINYAGDFENGGTDLAYALMVLAREGAAAIGDLRYYADVKAADFSTPLALAQLGAALSMYGDQPRADALFRQASVRVKARPPQDQDQIWRADFGTHLRDAAGVLALALESGSTGVDRDNLAGQLAASAGQRALSTQEQAWILMATHGLAGGTGAEALQLNGSPVNGPLVQKFDPGAGAMTILNGGTAPSTLTIAAFGQLENGTTKAEANGYQITRSYYGMDGGAIDQTQVSSGTRMVVVLEVTPTSRGEGRIMVDDALPAGFEIDNPNLLASGQIAALDWLEVETDVTHSEFRQNRFMSVVERHDDSPFSLAYVVRAVSPGTYYHPPALVEDMYRPIYRGSSASGRVTVTK